MSPRACRLQGPLAVRFVFWFRRLAAFALAAIALSFGACVASPGVRAKGARDHDKRESTGVSAAPTRQVAPIGVTEEAPVASGRPPTRPLDRACLDYALELQAAGITPQQPVDYLALRERIVGGERATHRHAAGTGNGTAFTVFSESGTPCGSASNDECEQRVTRAKQSVSSADLAPSCREVSVVTTLGDEVRVYAGEAQVWGLLGQIDTLHEAGLLVEASGFQVCGGRISSGGRLLIYAVETSPECGPRVSKTHEIQVDHDGGRTTLRSLDGRVAGGTGDFHGHVPAVSKSGL